MSDTFETPPNDRVIKTYVWHGDKSDKSFLVSTIERTSSAAANPCRYNETIVWAYDWTTHTRGAILHQGEATVGSIKTHQQIVESLYRHGTPEAPDSKA
jgi:hypothetical protein